jgi:hypothetical protein
MPTQSYATQLWPVTIQNIVSLIVGGQIILNPIDHSATVLSEHTFADDVHGAIRAMVQAGTVIKVAGGSSLPNMMNFQSDGLEAVLANELVTQYTDKYAWGMDFGIDDSHLIFDKPVKISMPVDASDNTIISLKVKHAGSAWEKSVSLDPTATCNPDGTITNPSALTKVVDGAVEFYTCGASSFAAVMGFDVCNDPALNISVAECEALADFFVATDGMNWVDNSNWWVNNDVSTWYWITVANNHVQTIW